MQKILRGVAVVAVVLLLGACSLLGLTPATSPSQGLAYAYGTLASIRTSTANALGAGTISTTQAQSVLTYTDKARTALDAGEALVVAGSTDSNSIAGDLATATSLIQQAQAILPIMAPAKAPVAASTPLSGTAL